MTERNGENCWWNYVVPIQKETCPVNVKRLVKFDVSHFYWIYLKTSSQLRYKDLIKLNLGLIVFYLSI